MRDQLQVWTETFERESGDLLGLQAELGEAIARQIQLKLSPQRSRQIAHRQTRDPGAYDLYLRGRHLYNRMTPASAERALDCFRQAAALDPGYALAWAGIADTWSSRLAPGLCAAATHGVIRTAHAARPPRTRRTRAGWCR